MTTMWSFHRAAGSRSPAPTIGDVVGLLAVRNLVEVQLSDWAYVPTNVALGAVLVGLSRRRGLRWQDLGLDRRNLRGAFALGGMAASLAVGAMLLGAALPMTHGLFDDGRVPGDASGSERLYQTLIRIPVGTAAFEELAFRGVLLALFCRRFSAAAAVTLNSALFGLWHIVPTIATARANDIVGLDRVGLLIGSVVVTFAGGLVFCALRQRGGHLIAPVMLHVAFNDAGYLLAWWTRR